MLISISVSVSREVSKTEAVAADAEGLSGDLHVKSWTLPSFCCDLVEN